MSDQPISIGAWFGRGWASFRANQWALIGGYLPMVALGVILQLVWTPAEGTTTPSDVPPFSAYSVLIFVLTILVELPLIVGFYALCLGAVRGEQVRPTDVFEGFSYFGPALLTAILYALIVFGGMLLLIVPGLIWGLRYSMSWFAITDKGFSGRAALRLSGKITKGHKGKLLVVFLIGGALVVPLLMVSHLAPVAGPILVHAISLFLYPVLIAAVAAAYESLLPNAELQAEEEDVQPTPESPI